MVIIILLLQFILATCSFKFGVHYPNGYQALSYIYSRDGFWKPLNNLNYLWNKYSAATNHDLNLVEFNSAVIKGQFLTCKDLEGHLLGDVSPMDGELDSNIQKGYAFHTHNAKTGSNTNHATIKPEYTFFYDDNYLGRLIANIYGTDIPFGLGVYNDAIQWSILMSN